RLELSTLFPYLRSPYYTDEPEWAIFSPPDQLDELEDIVLAEREGIVLTEREDINVRATCSQIVRTFAQREDIVIAEREGSCSQNNVRTPCAQKREDIVLAEREGIVLAEREDIVLAEREDIVLAGRT
ncbi:hypothetical protein BaRGS_00038242, partial [Batillaria attramentaria]